MSLLSACQIKKKLDRWRYRVDLLCVELLLLATWTGLTVIGAVAWLINEQQVPWSIVRNWFGIVEASHWNGRDFPLLSNVFYTPFYFTQPNKKSIITVLLSRLSGFARHAIETSSVWLPTALSTLNNSLCGLIFAWWPKSRVWVVVPMPTFL